MPNSGSCWSRLPLRGKECVVRRRDESREMEARQMGVRTERPDYEKRILDVVRSRNSPIAIERELRNFHANDLAEVLPALDPRERETLYRILGMEHLAEILEYAENAWEYLDEMDIKRAVGLMEQMEPDEAAEALGKLEAKKQRVLLELMAVEPREKIQLLTSYGEDRIASRMTTNFVAVNSGDSVKEAMSTVIREAEEHDNIAVIYVLDEQGVFYGAVSLKDLIIARKDQRMEDIVVTEFPYVYGDEEIDACLEMLKDYSEDSIPVLSDQNRILGVITAQDLVEVVDDELGEDYAMLAGLTAEEDLKESILESMKKRLPWLMFLLALGFVVSGVVGSFEGVVAQLPLLISFQPLILDMAGNVGTQSLAVTIRVLMDEKLTGRQKWFLVWKELRVGLSNGLILGVLSFAGIGLYINRMKGLDFPAAFLIAAVVGLVLMVAMAVSSLVGTVIPMAFKQLGVDPAVASGPLITTVNDLVAIVTYYGLAWILLLKVLRL